MNRVLSPFRLLACATLALGMATGCEPSLLPEPGTYPQTSRLGVSEDGERLFVALEDHDLLRVISAESKAVLGEVAIAGGPHRLSVLSNGMVAVTARRGGTVHFVDVDSLAEVAQVFVGAEPYGVIEADGHAVVALSGESALARIAFDDLTRVKDRVVLERDDPRGLARAPDGKIYVSHFTAGTVGVVDVEAGVVETDISMDFPSQSNFFPNQIDSITVTPTQEEIVVPHVQCNNDPAQFTSGTGSDFAGASVEYYVEGPTGFPAVVPSVGRIDTTLRTSLSDAPSLDSGVFANGEVAAGAPPAVINPLNTRLLGDDVINAPVAVAMADGGRLEIVVNRGSGNAFIRRNNIVNGQGSILAKVEVGVGADAIVLSPDGATAYVFNAFDYSITHFAVPRVARTAGGGAASVAAYRSDEVQGGAIAELSPLSTTRVANPILPDAVAEGRHLFHAVDERLTRRGAVSCASCHPGGGDDGITWAFEIGPRQTPPLWGGILGTEPFHWNEEVRDMADISTFTIERRMGGEGLPPSEMMKIGAFLDTLPAPAPPANADFASIERGAQVFYAEATGCAECHQGSDFTDNQRHDVGTGVGFAERETDTLFATPPLKGLAHSAPYLHDGSAQTLRELVEKTVVTDRMGRGSHLSAQEIDDLVHFLEQL